MSKYQNTLKFQFTIVTFKKVSSKMVLINPFHSKIQFYIYSITNYELQKLLNNVEFILLDKLKVAFESCFSMLFMDLKISTRNRLVTKVYQCYTFKQNIEESRMYKLRFERRFFYVRNHGRCVSEESLPTAIFFADERIFRTTEFLLPCAIPCFTILPFATEENVFVDCKSRVFNIREGKRENRIEFL